MGELHAVTEIGIAVLERAVGRDLSGQYASSQSGVEPEEKPHDLTVVGDAVRSLGRGASVRHMFRFADITNTNSIEY